MEKTELLHSIERIFQRDEKFSRRLERCIQDININTGLGEQEILDFLRFGADSEIESLDKSYDWNGFTTLIIKKLKKGYS